MDRSSFIKSLFVVAAAPKIIGELNLTPVKPVTSVLFNDMHFMIPDYLPTIIKKYGNEDYTILMKVLSKEPPLIKPNGYYHYETRKI